RAAERASRLAKKPQVVARVQELLRQSTVRQIDSVGQAHADLLADMEAARAAENWTALAAFTRTRASILGMIKDSMSFTVESQMSGDALIKQIAADDPELAALLRRRMGNMAAFGARDRKPSLGEGDEPEPTTH